MISLTVGHAILQEEEQPQGFNAIQVMPKVRTVKHWLPVSHGFMLTKPTKLRAKHQVSYALQKPQPVLQQKPLSVLGHQSQNAQKLRRGPKSSSNWGKDLHGFWIRVFVYW